MTPAEQLWMDHSLTIAVAQFSPGPDEAENERTVSRLAARLAQKGAQVIAFPEYSHYFNRQLGPDFVEHAQDMDGSFVSCLSQLAQKHGVTLIAGFGERVPDSDRVYNTVVAVGPDGLVRTTYRKVHLFDAFGFQESQWVQPGDLDQMPVLEISGLTFGLQTCYDLRFPEVTRRLVSHGAEVVVLPAQWVPGSFKEHHWNVLLQARAIENIVYMVGAGQCMPFGVGRSAIIDPQGYVLAQAGADEGFAIVDVDAPHLAVARGTNPALELRRYRVVPQESASADV